MYEPFIALLPGERQLWSGRPQRVVPTGIEWFLPAAGTVAVAAARSGPGIPVRQRDRGGPDLRSLGTLTFTEPDLVVEVLGYSVPLRFAGSRSPIKFVAVAEPERIRELVEVAQAAD
ncbi:hypothetical protein [Amycolatopsis tolypomycina]|uniref:Uncharacterized protein n=1 Tax=Amycolatopsis tolypomycina TaxID=208445 RepID=A0A1H5BD57_9PSEU|nr:hypothetical protein [Amycolatopsis tolypomycina]SED52188.1 hypothetical protein SAMN04489727_8210 [Amycolatopsis tolypomycina]